MTTDFLNMSTGDVKEPQPLPDGEYILEVSGYSIDQTQGDEPKQFVRFRFRPVEVVETATGEDVDLEGKVWKTMDERFYLTDKAIRIVKDFLTKRLGLDDDDGEKTFVELFEESIGVPVRAVVKVEMVGRDKNVPINTVDRFLRLDAA